MMKLPWLKGKHNHNLIVGLSLNQSGLAFACVNRSSEGNIDVHGCEYQPSANLVELSQILRSWSHQYHLKGRSVNYVLDPQQFQFMLVEAPQVQDSELNDALRWKVKDMMEYKPGEAVIDSFSIPGQRERGRQPMAYVVSTTTTTVKEYADSIDETDLILKSIDIPAMVMRNVACHLPEDEAGVAFVHMTEYSGVVTVTRQGVLYLARELDVGFKNFDLSHNDNVDTGLELDGMPPATQNTLDTIILEVQRSLDYYESHFAQPPVQNLVIAPTPEIIPGMIDYIASQLGIMVREIDLNKLLNLQKKLERDMQAYCLPVIGAALRWPLDA